MKIIQVWNERKTQISKKKKNNKNKEEEEEEKKLFLEDGIQFGFAGYQNSLGLTWEMNKEGKSDWNKQMVHEGVIKTDWIVFFLIHTLSWFGGIYIAL